MKKNIKAVIGCVAALAIAGGGYAALKLSDSGTTSESSSQAETSQASVPVSLLDFEQKDITSITVENSAGSFEAVPEGEPADDNSVQFTIKGIEDLDVNYTLTSSLANSCAKLSSDSTAAEGVTDFDKYGLKTPQAKFTVKTSDSEKTILVGNESPVSGETYCMEDGSDTVYLVGTSSVSVFANSTENFVSTTLLEDTSSSDSS